MGIMVNLYSCANKGLMPYGISGTTVAWGSLLATSLKVGDGTILSSNGTDNRSRQVFLCKAAADGSSPALPGNHYSCHPLLMPNILAKLSGWPAFGETARSL